MNEEEKTSPSFLSSLDLLFPLELVLPRPSLAAVSLTLLRLSARSLRFFLILFHFASRPFRVCSVSPFLISLLVVHFSLLLLMTFLLFDLFSSLL